MTDISTSGWDVVSITDLKTVNSIINTKRDYPSEFIIEDENSGDKIRIDCQWGTWTVTPDGSGSRVSIQCEITEGKVLFYGETIKLNNDSENSWVKIELSLKGRSSAPENWANKKDTVIDSTRADKLMVDPDSKVIVTEAFFSGASKSRLLKMFLQMLIEEWFNDNIDNLGQVFAVILIGLKSEATDFEWLSPSAYSYAMGSSIDKKTAGFGVLTLTDGKTGTGHLQQGLDTQALNLVKTFGANMALVISKSMFVKHILLPAAISLIKGAVESDFTLSDTGLSLSNNREILWQDFDNGKGGTLSPVLPKNGFILTLQSDCIHLSITGAHYRPNAMCTVAMGIEQNFRYKVEKNGRGEPIFVPDETGLGDAQVTCSVTFDKWVQVFELTMGIITGIATLISLGTAATTALAARAAATYAADSAAELTIFSVNGIAETSVSSAEAVAISSSILRGVASNPTIFNAVKIASIVTAATTGLAMSSTMIAKAVYGKEYDDIPSFNEIARRVTGSTVWPGINNTELKSASLADSFVIGLEIK